MSELAEHYLATAIAEFRTLQKQGERAMEKCVFGFHGMFCRW